MKTIHFTSPFEIIADAVKKAVDEEPKTYRCAGCWKSGFDFSEGTLVDKDFCCQNCREELERQSNEDLQELELDYRRNQ